jgi:hypothetical protein
MGMFLFTRDDPDGWDETGVAWADTAQYHERMLFNQEFAENEDSDFVWSTQGFLNRHGIATADEIVEFFSTTMYHGTLSTSNRNLLLEFANTDNDGAPEALVPGRAGYITRVQELVGLILSMPHWHFQ